MDNTYLPSESELLQLIKDILSGNNQKIQLGTKFLKAYTKRVECIDILLNFIQLQNDISIRQFSAILLKRNIIQLYQKLNEQQQNVIKQVILNRFFEEQQNNIRNTLGAIIGSIASITVQDQKWPQLFAKIGEKTLNQDENSKREGLQLLGYLIESSGSYLEQYYSQFMDFFLVTIQNNQEKRVRKQTLKNIMYLLENIEDFNSQDKEKAKQLMEPVCSVLLVCLDENEEELGQQTLESLGSVLESSCVLDVYLVEFLRQIVKKSILVNREISINLREGVLDLLLICVENKRKLLNKNISLVKEVVETLVWVVKEPLQEDDYLEERDSIQDIALQLLEQLAINLNKKIVYPHAMAIVDQLLLDSDTNSQSTAYLILASIVEGCAIAMRKHLDKIINSYVIPGLQSALSQVKGPAIKLICQLSEYLSQDILVYHNLIVEGLLSNIQTQPHQHQNQMKVNEKALIALDILIENMEKQHIQKHLQLTMTTMLSVVASVSTTGFMKQLAMSCIGSIVAASGQLFIQYSQELSQYLHQIIKQFLSSNSKNDDQIQLVSESVLVLGRICYYVCSSANNESDDLFQSENYNMNQQLYVSCILPVMEDVYQLLHKEEEVNLRESALSFFYNIADSIGMEFAPLLDKIVVVALQIANSNKGISHVKSNKKEDFSLDTDSEDDQQQNGRVVNVKIGYMDEKAAAIHALGSMAKACPQQFISKYLDQTLSCLDENYSQFYDNIRVQSVHCYMNLCLSQVKQLSGSLSNKQKTRELVYPEALNEYIQMELFVKYLYYLEEDTSSEVVCAVLEALDELIFKLGVNFVNQNIDNLIADLILILKGNSKCLQEDLEDIDDVKETVYELITDLIPTLNRNYKQHFNIYFDKLFKVMYSFLDTHKDINLIIQMVGCFAECFKSNPGLITIYGIQVYNFLIKNALQLEDDEILRNTAFCLGIMSEKNPLTLTSQYTNIIAFLKQAYQLSTSLECKDNVIAALSRLIIGNSQAVPQLEQTIQNIFQVTPLKSDQQEQKTIVKFIIYLCQFQPQYAQQYLKQICIQMIDAIEQQKLYQISDKFILIVIQKIQLLVNNSLEAKQIVQEYVINIQDQNNKTKIMSLL